MGKNLKLLPYRLLSAKLSYLFLLRLKLMRAAPMQSMIPPNNIQTAARDPVSPVLTVCAVAACPPSAFAVVLLLPLLFVPVFPLFPPLPLFPLSGLDG